MSRRVRVRKVVHKAKGRVSVTRPKRLAESLTTLKPFGVWSLLYCGICRRTLAAHVNPRGRMKGCAYAITHEPERRNV